MILTWFTPLMVEQFRGYFLLYGVNFMLGWSASQSGSVRMKQSKSLNILLLRWAMPHGMCICHCKKLPRYTWNLTIFNIICWVGGTNDSSTKRLMFQVLLFFHNFLQNSFQKSFQFIFLFFIILQNSFVPSTQQVAYQQDIISKTVGFLSPKQWSMD